MGGALKALNPINAVKNVADKALNTLGGFGDTLGKVMKGDLGALFTPSNIMAVASLMGGPLGSMAPTALSLGTALAGGRLDMTSLLGTVTSRFGAGIGGQFGGMAQDLLQGRSTIDSFAGKFSTLGVQNPLLGQMMRQHLEQKGIDVSDAESLLSLPQNELSAILNSARGFSLMG